MDFAQVLNYQINTRAVGLKTIYMDLVRYPGRPEVTEAMTLTKGGNHQLHSQDAKPKARPPASRWLPHNKDERKKL